MIIVLILLSNISVSSLSKYTKIYFDILRSARPWQSFGQIFTETTNENVTDLFIFISQPIVALSRDPSEVLDLPRLGNDNRLRECSGTGSQSLDLQYKDDQKTFIECVTFFTSSKFSTTLPNTTCFPSSQGVLTVVIKNWEPFVSRPEFAIESSPGVSCRSAKFSSSNLFP